MKKATPARSSKTTAAPARRKLTLKKDAVKDLTAAGQKIKAGGYSYTCGGRSIVK